MQVSSKVTINKDVLRNLSKASVEALEKTAEALHEEVKQAQVVPRRNGTLQGEAFFCDYSQSANGKVTLVHNTPYARRMYFHPEYKFSKAENPYAGGKWYKDWLPGGSKSEFCTKAFWSFYKKEAKL